MNNNINPNVNRVGSQNQFTSKKGNQNIDRAQFNALFNQGLNNVVQPLQISNHASKRMMERNIQLDNQTLDKISSGLYEAKSKGASESLILYDDVIMIASATNNTIITAMDKNNIDSNVITNIDSAIFINK
jgi:flagellar operon protein